MSYYTHKLCLEVPQLQKIVPRFVCVARQHHLDLPYDWDCGQLLQSRWHHAHWAKVCFLLPFHADSCRQHCLKLVDANLFHLKSASVSWSLGTWTCATLWNCIIYFLYICWLGALCGNRNLPIATKYAYTSSQTWDSFNRKPIDAKYRAFLGSIDSIGLCLGILSRLQCRVFKP